MKKVLSVFLVMILLISGLFVFSGCGKTEDKKEEKKQDLSAVSGNYQGKYTKFVGDDDSAKVEDEPFSLELKADGTGTHYRDDYQFDVTWSLDGDKFKMIETFMGDSIEYTGTLKDDELDIFNGDPDDIWTCEYVYHRIIYDD